MLSDTESESEQECKRAEDRYHPKYDELIRSDNYRMPLDEILRILDDSDAYSHAPGFPLALVHQLDSDLRDIGTESNQRAPRIFQRIVTRQALSKLLQVRSKLRAEQPAATKDLVTWVDIVLAKLGSLVLALVDEPNQRQHNEILGKTLNKHIEQDAALAASQLPEQWEALPSALSAPYLSPAAKRLILCLLFGVLVIQSDLNGNNEMDIEDKLQGTINSLEASIDKFIQLDFSAPPPVFGDKVHCALFLSLYATIHVKRWTAPVFPNDFTLVKPRLESHLLALLDFILHPLEAGSEWNAMGSIAQAILFRWGKFVPWCWAIRIDHRLADAELITIVTILWLGAVGCRGICSPHKDCEVPTATVSENVFATFIALSDALAYGVSQLNENRACGHSILLVLDKACSFLSLVFHEAVCAELSFERQLRPHISRVCRSVLQLGVIRPKLRGVDTNASALDRQLELLFKMAKPMIQQCLTELQVDHHFLFSAKVDDVLSRTRDLLAEDEISPKHLSEIRSALGFLALLCNAGVRGIILREKVSPLFMRLRDRMTAGAYSGKLKQILLAPTIIAMTTAERYFPLTPFSFSQDELFWRLCLINQQTGIYASLAQAQYVLHSKNTWGWLISREMLDHFRDLVLNTITRRIPYNLEHIAQLACPSFCVAMIRLLREDLDVEARVARCSFKYSPWTVTLCTALQNLFCLELNQDPYLGRMRRILLDVGGILLDILSGIDPSGRAADEVPYFDTKLFFHQSQVVMVTTDEGFRPSADL